MTEKDLALNLLNEIIDWAISNDSCDYISQIEYDNGMTLDEAFNILNKDLTNN